MQELFIDLKEVEALCEKFRRAPEIYREVKAAIMDETGPELKRAVESAISQSGINDGSGHVRSWQAVYIGSKKGYAAVRATNESTGANSPGAITNYLESGHRTRLPSGRAKRYVPRVKKGRTTAYGFYKNTDAHAIAEKVADKLAEQIAARLGGN